MGRAEALVSEYQNRLASLSLLDGRGSDTMWRPVPLFEVTSLWQAQRPGVDPEDCRIRGEPVKALLFRDCEPASTGPYRGCRLAMRWPVKSGRCFPWPQPEPGTPGNRRPYG
jgi:hypothetical protein